jgi:outer membrane protein
MRAIRFLLCLLLIGTAASGRALDLLEAWQRAEAHDAQFAAARANLEAGREKAPQGLSGLLPVVELDGETVWHDTETRAGGVSLAQRYNTHGYALTLTQPVFRWQSWVAYDQAKLATALAEARYVAARQDLILRVAQAYFDVLNASATLEAARAQKTAIAQQLEQARQSFEVGAATIIDTYEAQSRHDLAQAQEIAGENELEIRREALRVIIGDLPESLAPLDTRKDIPSPSPFELAAWVEAARANNLSVQIQSRQVEIAAREVEKARAGHYPVLDLVASTGRAHGAPNTSGARPENDTATIGLQLTVPLFQGGYVSSKTREALALRQAAQAGLDSARREAALGARQSYLGVVNGLAQVRALEAALASSLAALESNKLGYEVGARINIDVLNAEQQVFSTRRDLARAYHDTLLARLKLKNAVGTLDEAELRAINALLRH